MQLQVQQFVSFVYDVWLNMNIFQCTYTSFIALTNYGAWILIEFEFASPLSLKPKRNDMF
jgi:hypothetical protein